MAPSHSIGKDTEYMSHIQRAARWAHSGLISSVPLLRTTLPFLHQFHRPSWPLCYRPFWNQELLPALNVPAAEEPQALFLGRPNPPVTECPSFRRR